MGITKFAVKYPVSVLMITLGVCLLGIISYNKLGTDLFPDLKNPALYIDLQAGERPPEEIEKQFVEKIEAMAARQEGVKDVSSSSKVGGATITVEYDWDQDMDAAFLDLQRSMSQIAQDEEITSLNVSRYDANATPVMIISMSHKEIKDMNELRKIAENYMRSELVRLEGVADIQLNGQENAFVEVKPDCRNDRVENRKYEPECFGRYHCKRRHPIYGKRGEFIKRPGRHREYYRCFQNPR